MKNIIDRDIEIQNETQKNIKRVINNELGYNKIDGVVYSHLRDLSSFFNIGKIKLSEDKTTFEIEVSQGELIQTIYKNFETYYESKIGQFRNYMKEYNENTLTDLASNFNHLPVSGNKIHKNYTI